MIYSFCIAEPGMYYDPPSKHLFIEANSKEEALQKFDEFIDQEEKRVFEIDMPQMTKRRNNPWHEDHFDCYKNLKQTEWMKKIKATIKEHKGPVLSTGQNEVVDSPTLWLMNC